MRAAVAYHTSLRVPIQRVLTDNGMALRSAMFSQACLERGIMQKFTRAYRPQINGKARRVSPREGAARSPPRRATHA